MIGACLLSAVYLNVLCFDTWHITLMLSVILHRQLYTTLTIKNDLSLLQQVFRLWKASANSTITSVRGINYSLTMQPLPPAITSKSALTGGNSLGLDPAKGPLVLLQLPIWWEDTSDDVLIETVSRNLVNDIDNEAKARGLHSDFIYLNYATKGQDPIAGYGIESIQNLSAASYKYDPSRMFQRQVPGGFKLLI